MWFRTALHNDPSVARQQRKPLSSQCYKMVFNDTRATVDTGLNPTPVKTSIQILQKRSCRPIGVPAVWMKFLSVSRVMFTTVCGHGGDLQYYLSITNPGLSPHAWLLFSLRGPIGWQGWALSLSPLFWTLPTSLWPFAVSLLLPPSVCLSVCLSVCGP